MTATAGGWVDARAVAEHLSVERSWVYDHADELGAVRLGSGPRARLRFRLVLVDHLLQEQAVNEPPARMVERKPQRRNGTDGVLVPLLPIRGRQL